MVAVKSIQDSAGKGAGNGAGNGFDDEFDIVIVGYGYAGGIAAIEAHDAGARVLLIDKMANPGGISVCSYGAMRSAHDAGAAFRYLKATSGGRTPDDVLKVLADGMAGIEPYMRGLARVNGAVVNPRAKVANYPFDGFDAFYQTLIEEVPNFDPAAVYPHVRGAPGGARVFRTLEDNIAERDVTIWLSAPADDLIADRTGGVTGVVVRRADGIRRVKARRGVILACGGFEANEEMKRQYWQMAPVLSATTNANTGDGIRMAQGLGARLWHMWHYHGSYGFQHPEYPYAIRMKRLPDWLPGREQTAVVQMTWIVVDGSGRRYMNECPPYMQDTSHRPMEVMDPVTQSFPRIPSYVVLDEVGRRRYRIGAPTRNDPHASYEWSEDNMAEVESGLLKSAETVADLAALLGMKAGVLEETLARWNAMCGAGGDTDFGRPAGTMMKIQRPPFYAGTVWPVVSNTQGGPVHDASQRVIDVNDRPIPRLYAAGELGSAFGHLYLSGANLAECLVTGRVAGRHAAGRQPWDGEAEAG
jgi:succinate dehydrogenase/fumarate reductase flavoprotein subunit